MLWIVFVYAIILYFFIYNKKLKIRDFFFLDLKENKEYFIFILIRWLLLSIILYFLTKYLFPDKLFIIQNQSKDLLYKIFFFYPILSAFPQEYIFCTFFFLRYSLLFKNSKVMIIMSALIFCFAHIFSLNYVAPILSIFGGYFFATTYKRTKSLLIVSLEHSLYGNTLFF